MGVRAAEGIAEAVPAELLGPGPEKPKFGVVGFRV